VRGARDRSPGHLRRHVHAEEGAVRRHHPGLSLQLPPQQVHQHPLPQEDDRPQLPMHHTGRFWLCNVFFVLTT